MIKDNKKLYDENPPKLEEEKNVGRREIKIREGEAKRKGKSLGL